eukprot:gene20583-26690_t
MKLRIIIERHLESVMLHHFFKNGSLLPYSLLKFGSIEDFLSASLNFVQELPRYVIGRAIENDILSIKICHTLLSQLNGKLLKIDFRNGILRRRFDGYPGLRVGSFSNSLEEYGEAALFINFIENNNILLKSQFQLPLTTNEYIGALSDFTGEIGRLAVIKATNREINIKLRAVQTNLKKIEDIIYELTIQSKGGKALKRELPVESKENDNYNNDE